MKRHSVLVPILLLVGLASWGLPADPVENAVSDQPSDSHRKRGTVAPNAIATSDAGGPDNSDGFAEAGWESMDGVRARPVPVPPRGPLALDELRPLPASYVGSGRPSAAQPISLASDHFDGDGVADLVCGQSGPDGHLLTLHRGNVDSIFPSTPEARRRRAEGTSAALPFHTPALSYEIPVRPDFLASGDFDNDGNRDVVVARLGGRALYLLGGDGRGGFRPTESHELPGAITALVAGEINRRDGLNDLVVAVEGADGPVALVFEGPEGALRRKPEIVPLPASANTMVLGRLRGDSARDLALAVGSEVLIVHGRDRYLTASRARRDSVAPPTLERLSLGEPAAGLGIGDFVWEEEALPELAVLSEDGVVVLYGSDAARGSDAGGRGDDSTPGEPPLKRRFEHRLLQRGAVRENSHRASPVLVPARASSWPTEDLIVLDSAGQRLHVVSGVEPSRASGGGAGQVRTISVTLEGTPVAVLPMRLNQDALADLVVLQEGAGPGVILTSIQATITVDTVAEAAVAGDGQCSFREALTNANTDSDTTAGDCVAGAGADAIEFNIAGGGFAIISPLTALPPIQDSVTLNGNSQGCPSPPCIGISGYETTGLSGLYLTGGSSTVRGIVISFFDNRGVEVESPGNFFEGNFFGTNETGDAAFGNGNDGLSVNFVPDNTIGGTVAAARNVAVGSLGGQGFQINGAGATGNQILGNYSGTDKTGTNDLGNFYEGVAVFIASDNTIGGVVPGARNVISGNDFSGVLLRNQAHDNLVVGNYIGTDVTGATPLGNTTNGVYLLHAPNNTIGSTAANGRNIVSGNGGFAVWATPVQSSGNKIVGNFIGTDVTGTIALGNGITVSAVGIDDTKNTQIGGTTPSAGNVISGNRWGISLARSGCRDTEILGNFIGTDPTGTLPLGNQQVGIYSADGAEENVIGGAEPGAGNVIADNGHGIQLNECTTGSLIQGNHIGVDVTGTVALGNSTVGIFLYQCDGNTVGGDVPGAANVISANHRGVEISNCATTGQVVQGNHIGVDVTGTAALGNADIGILVHQCSGNSIGGDTPGAGNVISANSRGVLIQGPGGPAENNRVQGNLIGTDVTGEAALGNINSGVDIAIADNNQIGGTEPGARNVISGNGGAGVRIEEGASGNTIQGNLIGTDISGTRALPNLNSGVNLTVDSRNTVVGDATPGSGNLISGNSPNGVTVASGSERNTIQGNLIGTDISGTTLLGNALKGVSIEGGAGINTIGGAGSDEGNVIAGSSEEGVAIAPGIEVNIIQGNSIFANGLLGVDLGVDGVTANDYQDPDSGANLLQNFPELNSADATFSSVTIDGSLNSLQNSSFRIEFFASSSCDASGHGEGERYLGFLAVTTDAAGDADFNTFIPLGVGDGEAVTATASSYGFFRNTSEFSACVSAACQQTMPMAQTIEAQDRSTFVWSLAADVRFVKGHLVDVDTYSTIGGGWASGVTSMDTSLDDPAPGSGLFYLVRPLGCGSWQTVADAQPGRDAALP